MKLEGRAMYNSFEEEYAKTVGVIKQIINEKKDEQLLLEQLRNVSIINRDRVETLVDMNYPELRHITRYERFNRHW